jgi:hypothetical protein
MLAEEIISGYNGNEKPVHNVWAKRTAAMIMMTVQYSNHSA